MPCSWTLACFITCFAFLFQCSRAAESPSPGLNVLFKTDGHEDSAVLPNAALFVPFGQAPSVFSGPGPFSAICQGFIAVELRSDFSFSAELNGTIRVEINGAVALEGSSKGETIPPGKLMRLTKGTNALTIQYQSPASGDGFFRLFWRPRTGPTLPVPFGALSHQPDPALKTASELRFGRELFFERNCEKCHGAGAAVASDLDLGAPDFDGIGSRRNREWMSQWINNPKSMRSKARMPLLFHETTGVQNAADAAAFLSTMRGEPEAKAATGDKDVGKKLFENLHCAACHNAPDGSDNDSSKIGLTSVAEKFSSGALPAFLKKPEAHFAAIRMPNFRFSEEEAANLGTYLVSDKKSPDQKAPDAEEVTRGREIVQKSGCLNCHSLKLDNQFKRIQEFTPDSLGRGCLAPERTARRAVPTPPDFGFSPEERAALTAFLKSGNARLRNNPSWEFAEHRTAVLNCRECHGKVEGFPPLEILGGKLKPEWTKRFIGGEVSHKPRPWLEARMPGFKHAAPGIAVGIAALHGHPPSTPEEPPIDESAAGTGQKLVSANGGFSCVSCHSIAEFGATQVFDSPGLNLAYSGERLLKSYFQRWVRNPLAIDPATKMPVYFDEEGRSPLAEIYDGDGAKQIDALWQYIRKGTKMPPPSN